jgi:hypothetical protein
MTTMKQRRAPRSYSIKPSRIISGDLSLGCAAFDISEGGMRVVLTAPATIPEQVLLLMPDKTLQAARRAWQRDDEVGFEFLSTTHDLADSIMASRAPTFDFGVILGLALRSKDCNCSTRGEDGLAL